MIYGYIRVSTDKQNTQNQQFEINRFCEKEGVRINKWVNETISSTTEIKKRQLWRLLNKAQSGDIVIATELSRLGRNLLQVMSLLNHCMNKNIQVWTIKDNYKLGIDIQSKVLAFAFSLSAEIERQLISQRTKEALNRLKSEGKTLGRPKGSKNTLYKLAGKEQKIQALIKKGVSLPQIAKMFRVDTRTLKTAIARMEHKLF